MKKLALTGLVLALTAAAPAANAQSQCPPGSWLCADITIGATPAPAPVIIEQAPPPPRVIVVPAPRPPRIIYTPAPPRVYYAPAPVVVYQPAPMYRPMLPPPRMYDMGERHRHGYVGIQGQVAGSVNGGGFVGAGLGLRFRGAHHMGAEISFNGMTGNDYNGDRRTEIPVSAAALFFFNPENRLQVYGVVGLGLSFANVEYNAANRQAHGGLSEGNYTFVGGLAGLGLELQLSPHFALFGDIRGFIRGRVDDTRTTNPEYSRTLASGTTQSTNASMGAIGQLGAVLYF